MLLCAKQSRILSLQLLQTRLCILVSLLCGPPALHFRLVQVHLPTDPNFAVVSHRKFAVSLSFRGRLLPKD